MDNSKKFAAGIKAKDRVQKFGEVFTPDSIVNDMIELVEKQLKVKAIAETGETYTPDMYIDYTYLEPACGDGQFLIRLLYRKLEQVNKLPVEQRRLGLVRALSTIYGVDIQEDNVIESRERMLTLAIGEEVSTFDIKEPKEFKFSIKVDGVEMDDNLFEILKVILEKNIMVGNTLEPDFFTHEWKFNGDKVTIIKDIFDPNQLPQAQTLCEDLDYMQIVSVFNASGNSAKVTEDTDNDEYDYDF